MDCYEKFDINVINVGLAWERWVRGLCIFLQANDINPGRQVSVLLHLAGPEVQDIYYSLADSIQINEDETELDAVCHLIY